MTTGQQAPADRISARRAVRVGLFAALLVLEAVLVIPHVSFSSAAVTDVDWQLIAAAIGCELVSVIAFSRMRRRMLRAGGTRIGVRKMGVLTLASNAVSATAPAGTALSAAYLYRQLRRHGVTSTVTVWALAAGSVVSGLAFGVLTVAGMMLDGDVDAGRIAGAVGVSFVLGAALVGALALATNHPRRLLVGVERVGRHLPQRWVGVNGERLHANMEQVLYQLSTISPRTRDWTVALVLSVLNWSADLACFVLCCYAVGARGLTLGAATLAYLAGLATIGLSFTPGGLGSVEAGMLIGLAHGGVAAPLALAAVLAYRLVAYVLMGAVGWVAWLGVRQVWQRAERQAVHAPQVFDVAQVVPAPV